MWSADTGVNYIGFFNINCHLPPVVDVDYVIVHLITTALMITTVLYVCVSKLAHQYMYIYKQRVELMKMR